MKTPRFFIALAIFAFVFTIALSSIDSLVRPVTAETLPVLRVNPWAGDPDSPGAKRNLPLEEEWGELRTSVTYEFSSYTQVYSEPSHRLSPWERIKSSSWFTALFRRRG